MTLTNRFTLNPDKTSISFRSFSLFFELCFIVTDKNVILQFEVWEDWENKRKRGSNADGKRVEQVVFRRAGVTWR